MKSSKYLYLLTFHSKNIEKSQISLNQKEQLVYNLIKSNQINSSNLKHVTLEDILNVSYQPNKSKSELSFLSSLPQNTLP